MIWILIYGSFPIAIFLIGFLAYFLKKKHGSLKRKRLLFVGVSTFVLCPALLPAGIMAAIPIPNIAFILIAILTGDAFAILPFYYNLGFFILPGACLTALVMWGISHIVFFERWDEIAKSDDE